ncbi:MAG: DsbA family protein [Anaerolineae bacterium]|nr:DsbA family protein [Anaerolineae bacterium]
MKQKRTGAKTAATKRRWQNPANQRHSKLKIYGLIMGIVAIAVIIVAAVVILNQPQANLPVQPAEVSLDKSEGDPQAPVVVVEYADFQCPYCRQFATGPERQLKTDYVDSGQVRFVFRHMAFIGDESRQAAQASECANAQGRFWAYHDQLFAAQTGENVGDFSADHLQQFAVDLGLDSPQFNQCLDSSQYQTKVQQEVSEAQRLGVNSTPTLFVNGQRIRQGSDYQTLQAAIEAALARK